MTFLLLVIFVISSMILFQITFLSIANLQLFFGSEPRINAKRLDVDHRVVLKSLSVNDSETKWCYNTLRKYFVIPKQGWGFLRDKSKQLTWKQKNCDNINPVTGRMINCDDVYGPSFIDYWKNHTRDICQTNTGKYICKTSVLNHVQCSFTNITLDLSKISRGDLDLTSRKTSDDPFKRVFKPGFIKLNCNRYGNKMSETDVLEKYLPVFDSTYNSSHCDVRIRNTPVIIVSHDYVYNLGHFFEDVMNWWLVSELLGVDTKDAILLSVDGLRPGNIIKGAGRWVQNPKMPDDLGPFRMILDVLFKQSIGLLSHWRNVSHPPKVCIEQAHFYPMQLVGFLWENFELVDSCSLPSASTVPSYLHQKFQLNYLRHWRQFGDLSALKASAYRRHFSPLEHTVTRLLVRPLLTYLNRSDVHEALSRRIRVVLLARKHVTSSATPAIRARAVANLKQVEDTLRSVPEVQLVLADFESWSLSDQVGLMASTAVLVAFHGAGMSHIYHMDPNQHWCCGVIELFPQRYGCNQTNKHVCNYHKRVGYANMARLLGFHYSAHQTGNNTYTELGTTVDANSLKSDLRAMLERVRHRPTTIRSDLLYL